MRLVLLVLATARLVRLVTEDSLGQWWVVEPVTRWAHRIEGTDPDTLDPSDGWRSKVASGIDCRWCVGFWIGVLVLLGEAVLSRIPVLRVLWRFALSALALNVVANAVGERTHTLS